MRPDLLTCHCDVDQTQVPSLADVAPNFDTVTIDIAQNVSFDTTHLLHAVGVVN